VINTLIVDDSALVRSIIRDFLESDGSFNIIGEAIDGEEGIQKILSLNPDLVTLDIEMPKMNGFEVIETVMKKTSVPIVVITSQDTAKTAYEATLKGALEFYSKDIFSASLNPLKRNEIYETLKRISRINIQENVNVFSELSIYSKEITEIKTINKRNIQAVVIASSTGGPKALSIFFSLIPKDFPVPIVVVQHNSSGFDKSFAQWLDTYTSLNVKVANEGEIFKAGTVYIAQTDRHLVLQGGNGQNCYAHYNDDPAENNQKPAADVLFRSAAENLKEAVISIVLTGMGSDGASGTRKIKEMGGITFAQDEDSSLIYGMPRVAFETGCVDIVLPLTSIPAELCKLVG